jgi:hypothetical protein
VLVDANPNIHSLKAVSCRKAIVDESLAALAKGCHLLSILDISYCSEVTDAGLEEFKSQKETWSFGELSLNGLVHVSNAGVSSILSTCEETLVVFSMALMDQHEINGEVCKAIAQCF